MKIIKKSIVLALIMLQLSAFSQTGETLVYSLEKMKVFKNEKTQTYTIKNKVGKTKYKDLKLVVRSQDFLQVIDKNNEAFFINNDLKKANTAENFYGLCGTVPHYELRVKETTQNFEIMEDETFYDYDNQEPAKVTTSIPKKIADSVFFINGTSSYNFTSNYNYFGVISTDPRRVMFIKDGKYGIWGVNETAIYDKITVEAGLLKLELNGLVGFYTIHKEPKYKTLGSFDNYLARFELPNGKKGYIDTKGNEYFD